MKGMFYAVRVADLMTHEYWEVVEAKNEDDAREQVNDMYARFGGRAAKVQPATLAEIEEYYKWLEIGEE